ncbi:MAG: hypothetical protein KIT43_04100 [Bauldia sp.]|nr:hypothetical protein [Bauldia sp.]MCW5717862.1 hypothetical protein [Bauldia sp.]
MLKHLKFWKRNDETDADANLTDEMRARLLILAIKNGQTARVAALMKSL